MIIGSIRDQRATAAVAEFVFEQVAARAGSASYELVDLADFDLPLLTSSVHPMAAKKQYEDPRVQAWSDRIDVFDGYIFVTPEYNHGVPGAFKNAVDSLGAEWMRKPVAFVGHGSVGGVRSIEQWRQILANFSMPTVRAELNFMTALHWHDGRFSPEAHHVTGLATLCDQLEQQIELVGNASVASGAR